MGKKKLYGYITFWKKIAICNVITTLYRRVEKRKRKEKRGKGRVDKTEGEKVKEKEKKKINKEDMRYKEKK